MNQFDRVSLPSFLSSLMLLLAYTGPAASADLADTNRQRPVEPVASSDQWSFTFTTYGWIPWMSGNTTVRGRSFDVSVDPTEIFGHLDWSTVPAWMSYAEARKGPIGLFNDIVYANLSGAKNFVRTSDRRIIDSTLGANISADYEQVTVEFGGAYEIWSGRNPTLTGTTAFDLLAGGRYWHQDTDISGDLATSVNVGDLTISGNRAVARSGSVDWVDPFVGARLRNQLAPGQELVVRADVGGFGVGSDASWQVLATYNWQMCISTGYVIDGYLGYRALSVDYSQGSGNRAYQYNVLQQGPVLGTTLHF